MNLSTPPPSMRRERRTRAQWSQLVREQAASGLSQQAFCTQQDLGLSTFSKWKRKFNGVTGSRTRPGGFIELPVGGSVSQPGFEVELELGDGVRLRIQRR